MNDTCLYVSDLIGIFVWNFCGGLLCENNLIVDLYCDIEIYVGCVVLWVDVYFVVLVLLSL